MMKRMVLATKLGLGVLVLLFGCGGVHATDPVATTQDYSVAPDQIAANVPAAVESGGTCSVAACQFRCHNPAADCCPEGPGGEEVCACFGC